MPSDIISVALAQNQSRPVYHNVRLSTHFVCSFDVKAQLSHRGDKLRLELVYLHISEYVIDETGDSRGSLGTYNADAADKRSIHGHFYKAKYMFHTTSGL